VEEKRKRARANTSIIDMDPKGSGEEEDNKIRKGM
jgi:hypothetical protein